MGQHLLVVCAWCNRVLSTAPAGAGVTHTICPSCLDLTIRPIENGVERAAERLPDYDLKRFASIPYWRTL